MIKLSFYHSVNNYNDDCYYDDFNFHPPDIELEISCNTGSTTIFFTQTNIYIDDWYNILNACKSNTRYKIFINDPKYKISIYTENGYTYFELFTGSINNTMIKIKNNKTIGIFEKIYQKTIIHNKKKIEFIKD
ncbi:hypothetical protein QJ854_gp745 [Moumouvirus goulette]|uniref:Uncharacterized protein n=1 Tax=Moumouvirus goulette TaxID=1247379 RepID=M1PWB4_9VIRU|nr:hypothetical protein QJ854_gp745 [Moumouvirus goulette]AGF85037.1 hypothetical protein glt_00228 [Moumouvirus goulette]